MINVRQGEQDCVMACIATVAQLSLQEIHILTNDKYLDGADLRDTHRVLEMLDIGYIQYLTSFLWPLRVYILTVPSLNYIGKNHCIVVKVNEDNTFSIFDPNEMNLDRKSYGKDVELTSWSEAIEIVHYTYNLIRNS